MTDDLETEAHEAHLMASVLRSMGEHPSADHWDRHAELLDTLWRRQAFENVLAKYTTGQNSGVLG